MLFLAGIITFTSCYKTDPDLISDDLTWSPDFSFAVGTNAFILSGHDTIGVDIGDFYTPPPDIWYDTLEFDLSDMVEEREIIDSVIFRINITNEFPTQSEVHIFYPEEGQQPSYDRSVTGEEPIEVAAGEIDDEGKVTIPSKKTLDVPLRQEQIDDLMTSPRLVIRTVVRNLYITEPVKQNLLTYRFITQLGVRVKISKVYE